MDLAAQQRNIRRFCSLNIILLQNAVIFNFFANRRETAGNGKNKFGEHG
jgi:hypothetical protein